MAADSRDWPGDPGLAGASPPGAGPGRIEQAAVTIVARSSGSSSGQHGRLAGQRAAEGSVIIMAVAVPEVELWSGAQRSATQRSYSSRPATHPRPRTGPVSPSCPPTRSHPRCLQYSCPICVGRWVVDPAVAPQVRPVDAGRRQPDNRVGGFGMVGLAWFSTRTSTAVIAATPMGTASSNSFGVGLQLGRSSDPQGLRSANTVPDGSGSLYRDVY